MSIIEQIKAEIERLKGQLVRGACASQVQLETTCKEEAYNEVLSFLDTLQEQPVCEGLEEEIGAYFKDWYVDESDQGYSLKTPTGSAVMGHMKNVARHFAQWGAEHAREQMMKEAVELWLVKDKDGLLALFTQEPTVNSHGWLQGGRRFEVYDLFGNEYEKFYPLQDKMEVYDKMKVKLIIIKED